MPTAATTEIVRYRGRECAIRPSHDAVPMFPVASAVATTRLGRDVSTSLRIAHLPPLRRSHDVSTLEQSRHLATAIPGPKSAALIDRKTARGRARRRQHHARVRRARGRRHRRGRRRQPAHRPGLRHRGHHDRQRVPARRRGGRRAGRRVHPHLLHGHALRGVRRRRRAPQPADPRSRARSARRCSTRAPRPSRTPSRSPGPTPASRRSSRSTTPTTAAPT